MSLCQCSKCRQRWDDASPTVIEQQAEIERLRSILVAKQNLITEIDLTLRVPAAEYVPVIRDVFDLIDEAASAAGGKHE